MAARRFTGKDMNGMNQPRDFSKEFEVDLPEFIAKPPPKPKETDIHKLAQRQKQIDYGKNTIGYHVYCKTIPKYKRDPTKGHLETPDVYQICSKRGFDGQVKKWRRMLHDWDMAAGGGDAPVPAATAASVNPFPPSAAGGGGPAPWTNIVPASAAEQAPAAPAVPGLHGQKVGGLPLPQPVGPYVINPPSLPGSGQKRQHHQAYQDAQEHESVQKSRRMTHDTDTSWQQLTPEEQDAAGGGGVKGTALNPDSGSKADAGFQVAAAAIDAESAPGEKSIYDDWDDDAIAL